MNPPNINIALADDHVVLRKGVASIVSDFGNEFRIVMEANDGTDLIDQLENADEFPHVCLLDLNMKIMSGFDALLILKRRWPEIKILIFTNFTDDYSFLRVLKGGANGIISKGCKPLELKRAIKDVCEVGFYYSENLPADILSSFKSKVFRAPKISKQEKVFLSYCCSELTYSEIADKMGVGVRTVDGYRDNLFDKLGITSRAGLILFVVRSGIVNFPSIK
ncbi:MAG: response regulator [Flavipsychrobacter sp.]